VLELTEVASADELGRGDRLRVYASAQHPIALGAVLVMLLPLAVYLARATRQRRWWVAGGLLLITALATVSRTAVLMLLAMGLVLLWLRPVETRRLWPLIIPAALALHLALPGTIGTLRQSFFPEGGLIAEQQKHPGSVGSGRLADLGPSLDEAAKQPLLGFGYGTRVVDGPNPNARILDNQWLGTLLEIGLVGLAAWLWLFTRFIRRLGRAAKEDDSVHGWLLAAIVSSVFAYAVGMLTFDAFSFIQVTFVLFILLGLGCVAYADATARSARTAPAR
jgi:polysaccharide biosynthesis protein PslJ